MNLDLLALGETMYTLSTKTEESLDGADWLQTSHAGAESNTCVAAARLGLSTAWVSRLGADPAGAYVRNAISREGVNVDWVIVDPTRPTGLMLKDITTARVYYYCAGSAASALTPPDLDPAPIAQARAVLVTGVTALISESAQHTAVELLQRARGLRIVDPNLRVGLWGSDRTAELITPLIKRADIVLGGELELRALFGGRTVGETLANTIGHGAAAPLPGTPTARPTRKPPRRPPRCCRSSTWRHRRLAGPRDGLRRALTSCTSTSHAAQTVTPRARRRRLPVARIAGGAPRSALGARPASACVR